MDESVDREFSQLRYQMVEQQIRARGIVDEKILSAFLKIPRHEFVPQEKRKYAYEDTPISIGYGQTISQPYMVALMTSLLSPRGDDIVLEVGTGSGYQTAILSLLVKRVYTVEKIENLSLMAKQTLANLGMDNIVFSVGDGSLGWEEFAPYDKIIVTAAAPHLPESLVSQLKNGGKMVIPVGSISCQKLIIVDKYMDGRISQREEGLCVFVPLVGENGWQ